MTLRPPEDLKGFTPFYDGTAVHFACPHCTTLPKKYVLDVFPLTRVPVVLEIINSKWT